MAKYINADQIRAEIKRYKSLEEQNFASCGGGGQFVAINILEKLLDFLDTLPEQPAEGRAGEKE